MPAAERARYGDMDETPGPDTADLPIQGRDVHFQQLYAKPPDFKALARLDPEFAAVYVAIDIPGRATP